MAQDNYKIKIEYGVSAVVSLIGLFFVYQAFTIGVSKEAVGPRTMPMALAVSLVLGGLFGSLKEHFVIKQATLKTGMVF